MGSGYHVAQNVLPLPKADTRVFLQAATSLARTMALTMPHIASFELSAEDNCLAE
jgi:hypothetical protein